MLTPCDFDRFPANGLFSRDLVDNCIGWLSMQCEDCWRCLVKQTDSCSLIQFIVSTSKAGERIWCCGVCCDNECPTVASCLVNGLLSFLQHAFTSVRSWPCFLQFNPNSKTSLPLQRIILQYEPVHSCKIVAHSWLHSGGSKYSWKLH